MIHIVRHGQTDWNVEGRYQGRLDIDINEKGIEQAKIMRDELLNVKFDKVISSPLKRAIQTAQIISQFDNVGDIIIDERIIERCNGELEGKLKTEIPQNIDFNDPNTGYGIETITDFRKRIKDFCDELKNNYKDEDVLVVTHGGVSIYIRCYFEGEPEKHNYLKYKMKNCEVIKYNN